MFFEEEKTQRNLSQKGFSETSFCPPPPVKEDMCTTDCCSYADVQLLYVVDGGGGGGHYWHVFSFGFEIEVF